jgi:hypothetical protein
MEPIAHRASTLTKHCTPFITVYMTCMSVFPPAVRMLHCNWMVVAYVVACSQCKPAGRKGRITYSHLVRALCRRGIQRSRAGGFRGRGPLPAAVHATMRHFLVRLQLCRRRARQQALPLLCSRSIRLGDL